MTEWSQCRFAKKQWQRDNMLSEAILKTIVYFDIFDYPLTPIEIWRFLYQESASLSEIIVALENNERLKTILETKNGFYFLKGREGIAQMRIQRAQQAMKKWKITQKAASLLRFVPFVQFIAICNDLAYQNAPAKSDIDFFICLRRGRIWTGRFLVTALLYLAGLWRHNQKITNRICLSFFITDETLNLEPLLKQPADPYFAFWLATLWPIFDQQVFQKFFQANAWLQNYFPDLQTILTHPQWSIQDSAGSYWWRKMGERILGSKIGDYLEKFFRWFQIKKMCKTKKCKPEQLTRGTDVIINDEILKFHEHDTREAVRKKWEENLKIVLYEISKR